MISIIVPVLNEEKIIGDLLVHLSCNASHQNIKEIIVVDGGSTDGTTNMVTNFAETSIPITLIESPKGRAKQMNLGAHHASGSILYFLHADSFPPKDFDTSILTEVAKGNQAGCFRMQFDHTHWWLRLAGWLTQFKSRACRGGDQSQFISKGLFNDIGGYDEHFIIYEDNMLINELYSRKEFVVIQDPLITSARLYRKKGVWRLQYHFWAIYVKKWFGASADELYNYYKKNIVS